MTDWPEVKVDDIALAMNTGLDAIRRAPIVSYPTDLRCLRIQDISNNKIYDDWGYTEVKDTDYEKYRLREGEFGWGATEFIVMRPRPPLPNEFGYFLARDPDVRQHAIKNMTGKSGRQRVAKDCFDAYSIAVPDERVADEFAKAVDPITAKIRMASVREVTRRWPGCRRRLS